MKQINFWLIKVTSWLLRNPKLFILLPILTVLLFAYDAFYDLTLRPINSKLLFHYNNSTLHNGVSLLSSQPGCQFNAIPEIPTTYRVMKIVMSGENTLRFDYLKKLYEFEQSLPDSLLYVSPLSPLSLPLASNDLIEEDFEKIEKYTLRVVNHDCSQGLVKFFFNDITKMNHLICLAEKLFLYVFYDPSSQDDISSLFHKSDLVSDIHHLTDESIIPEFVNYFNFVTNRRSRLTYSIKAIKALQLFGIFGYAGYIFLCISNSHKIRSTLGLVIGWVISVFVSSLASIGVVNLVNPALYWPDVVGATNWISPGFLIIFVMLFSSRNLIRTINDLAGDTSFGASENIHKRLIKFYFGINNSTFNLQGIYYLNRLVRKYLFIDRIALLIPIPNTTIILILNIFGTTLAFSAFVMLSKTLMGVNSWILYLRGAIHSYIAFLSALLIDHFLQLSFIVGIIIIDLNRIDLTDLMAQSNMTDQDSSSNEINCISAALFGRSEKVSKNSWRHRLATYFLKVGSLSLSFFWFVVLPVVMFTIFFSIGLITNLIIPSELSAELIELLNFNSTVLIGQQNNFLYYSELLAVIIFIIAISELTFVCTYSKRQRIQQDYSAVLVPLSSQMSISDLVMNEKKKLFECINLRMTSNSEILKLNANTKCPLLVSTDLDHKVIIWTPSKTNEIEEPVGISTIFGSHDKNAKDEEFWPINHIEVSDNGFFIVLINYNRCRLKCYDRRTNKFVWEVSLISELTHKKRMHAVATFYRKKTVAGFLARKMLLKQNKSSKRRGSNVSLFSSQNTNNYPPPQLESSSDDQSNGGNMARSEKNKCLHRDEFCMVLETGEMITISCDTVKIKVYDILNTLYEEDSSVKIISLKLLQTARVNDRVVCNLSNDEIVVGTAVNNIWRFNKLQLNVNFSAQPQAAYAPPLMKRTGSANREKDPTLMGTLERQQQQGAPGRFSHTENTLSKKFPPINKSHIVTINFVGMFVRVQNLHAELIDVMTGTILKVFYIGSFKPGSFRVAHSEPSHCKFCGCASVESMSLIYEDFYDKTLIVHSYTIENKKSRSNICLRVERDPREVRCLGFDSVKEQQFWYNDIEKWELTDMNVIMGIKKANEMSVEDIERKPVVEFNACERPEGLSSLRSRKKHAKSQTEKKKVTTIKDLWQGFVITVNNGKLLNYSIPCDEEESQDLSGTRPNFIAKYGYKAIAIAFGNAVKVLYLGTDHLIENDLYYSGTTSSLNQILRPAIDGQEKSNSLLFISKRRNMMEQKRSIKPSESLISAGTKEHA